MSEHLVLLGDSIFDNGKYTRPLPDVVTHLRGLLPEGTSATLLAVDGSTTGNIEQQLERLPPDASLAAVSLGGNDAILHAEALDLPISSTREALAMFGERASSFEASYRAAITRVIGRVPSTVVCTIYDARLPGDEAALARVGLMLFNDAILRVAFELHLPVIDLRLVCVEPADYANPLEPSSQGAAKIAKSIAAALGLTPGSEPISLVFASTMG